MPDNKSDLIESLASGIRLVEILAEPYEPRTFKDIVALCHRRGESWSPTKVHAMIQTLCEVGWVTRYYGDLYAISPQLVRITIAFQRYLADRTAAIKEAADTVTASFPIQKPIIQGEICHAI